MNNRQSSIESLENEINEKKIPIEMVISAYKNYLLYLIGSGKFKKISAIDLDALRNFILICSPQSEDGAAEELSSSKLALWLIADSENEKNSEKYNLVRSIIFLYGTIEDWENSQDSPIFYFLSYLEKSFPNIESDFVNFIRSEIFNNQRS